MDSVSPELATRLEALGLCRPDDFRRCRSRVRRLSRDLPAFDSVWLDVLVQIRRLTPFQSRLISDGDAEQLVAGPYIIRSRLAADGRLTTYLARHNSTREPVLLTVVSAPGEQQPRVLERLRESLERLPPGPHPHLNTPRSVHLDRDRIVVVSNPVSGPTLGELIVRRGRFPLPVVHETARQLVSGLARLEAAGTLHGDLRLRNVRLDPSGLVVLLNAGLIPAISPVVTIHTDVPPDCYDGVAPELIGTHQERSTASDIYAFGCLLWELIAGRPPFTTGDPLSKLAAHQSRTVADVRDWNPDTPAPLADLIRRMTSRDPAERPRSFREVEQALGHPTSSGRRVLRRFARTFQSAAPRAQTVLPNHRHRSLPRTVATTTLLLLILAAGALSHRGARNELLRIVGRDETPPITVEPDSTPVRTASLDSLADQRPSRSSSTTARPLPTPDRHGVVTLSAEGIYQASPLSTVGPLTLKGPSNGVAVVHITDAPWRLAGTVVVLENVQIEAASKTNSRDVPLLEVTAQDFGLSGCSISQARVNGLTNGTGPLVRWELLSNSSVAAGRLGLRDTLFHGGSAAIETDRPRSVHVQNTLCVGTGSLLRLRATAAPVPITLRQVTLRETAIIALPQPDAESPVRLQVSAERCVFQPEPDGGLIEYRDEAGRIPSRGAVEDVSITGVESLLQTSAALVVRKDISGHRERRDADALNVEGLQYADLRFEGAATRSVEHSSLSATTAQTTNGHLGIDASAFPGFRNANLNTP